MCVIPDNYLAHVTIAGGAPNQELFIEGGLCERGPTIPKCVVAMDGEGKTVLPVLNMTGQTLAISSGDTVSRAEACEEETSRHEVNEEVVTPEEVNTDLTGEEAEKLLVVLNDNRDLVARTLRQVGKANRTTMRIELVSDKPVIYRPYQLSYYEREKLKDMIIELKAANIVEDSTSPFASPVLLVRKKSDEIRMRIDYRGVNKATVKDSMTVDEGLTRLSEVFDAFRNAGLTINLKKCNFLKSQIEYLAFEISIIGIQPSERKLESVSADTNETESCLTSASIFTHNLFSSGLKSLSGEEVTRIFSELSIGTQLPVINQALLLLNITPLNKYAINDPSYLSSKYNDICSTCARLLSLDNECNHYENSLNYQNILENLKTKFDDPTTNRTEKLQILTLLPSDWSIQMICDVMGATKHMAIVSKHLKENKGILSMSERKKGRPLTNEIKSKVIEFYQRDDISINLPGKKDFVSVKRGEGQREHIQKKLILCNLKELYQTFKEQYPNELIGFSSFASLRPVHCVLAGSVGTHTVCVCAIHQNVKLMMLGSNLPALTGHLTDPLMHFSDCFKIILCANPSSDCYLSKCKHCPEIDVLQNV
ncbi:uncharacterized protein LOC128882595 [Hylaeus volcanicus]|uniref:uncharacterized protein LOC128882595 n=1 Tax=Hylaeus volcanicus TaxID=313075 RepID=UPI0023B8784C|nr:uncharacterized protein LOC128882595 [Hylaeus volcanicus]